MCVGACFLVVHVGGALPVVWPACLAMGVAGVAGLWPAVGDHREAPRAPAIPLPVDHSIPERRGYTNRKDQGLQ